MSYIATIPQQVVDLMNANAYLLDEREMADVKKGPRRSKRLQRDMLILGRIMEEFALLQQVPDTEEDVYKFINKHCTFRGTLFFTYLASLRYWTYSRYIAGTNAQFTDIVSYLAMFDESDIYHDHIRSR